MKMFFTNIVGIIFIILVTGITSNDDDEKEKIFIPTSEWQTVKKGQKIPKGLHVRINFETGVTEAKLLEGKNDENRALQISEKTNEEELLKTEEIQEALKNIQGDDILKVDDIKKIKEKFRSYDEIKKDMSDLNLTPKIDAEVLKDLFNQYKNEMKKNKVNVREILRILEDLDFLAHQFDNALEFVRQNGFKEIIYKNLNLTNSQIKQDTLKLFGSLVQNNGKAQIHALETGSISILLRTLHLEKSIEIKSRAIYALSCLLRRFPLAQSRFVKSGGISVITKILEEDPPKIQMKLVTFLNDLIVEHKQAIEDKSNENYKTLLSQYKLVSLENLLLENDWCEYLNKLLYSIIATDPNDHDSIEKCVLAMHTISNKCVGKYNDEILASLQERYKSLALNDLERNDEFSNSDFFTNLHHLCMDMLQQKNVKTEL